jgi:hypothetical protein
VLTGEFIAAEGPVDIVEIQQIIEHARDEAERRQRGREEADGLREKTVVEDDPNRDFSAE